jgi:hypothetical protein
MSVLLSVRLHWITRHPLDGFSWNLTSGYSSKVFRASLIFDHIALISAWRRKYLRLTQRNPKHTFHLWDNVEKYGRTRETKNDNTIRGMRYACWISTTTNTDSEFAKFIAFLRKKWLRERSPMLRYTYTAYCLLQCTYHRSKQLKTTEFLVKWCDYEVSRMWNGGR